MRLSTLALTVMPALLFGCATAPAPKEIRQAQFIEKTNVKKNVAYTKVLAHLAKSFGDTNHAIKVKDKENGQIIMHGIIACDALNVSAFQMLKTAKAPRDLSFNLDFQAKDNRVRFSFEDLSASEPGDLNKHNHIATAEDVEKVKNECLVPFKAEVMKSLGRSVASDNW